MFDFVGILVLLAFIIGFGFLAVRAWRLKMACLNGAASS